MCQYTENVNKSIGAYRMALKACHKLGVWPDFENYQPRYFHTPQQKLAISKLLNSQANHRFVIQNYAENVGPVPEHFLSYIHNSGFLMGPGVKRVTGLQALLFMLLMLAMVLTIPYIAPKRITHNHEQRDSGVSQIDALQPGK